MANGIAPRTFRGNSVAETMQRVKSELGPNPVIIEKREIPGSRGLFKLSAPPMVEIVAAQSEYLDKTAPAPAAKAGTLLERTYGQRPALGTMNGNVQVEIANGHHNGTEKIGGGLTPSALSMGNNGGTGETGSGAIDEQMLSAVRSAVHTEMHNEILRMTSKFACGNLPQVGERLMAVYNQMLDNGVSSAIASDLVLRLQDEIGLSPVINDELLKNTLLNVLSKEFHTAEPVQQAPVRGPKIISLIGPSGGGKTTTVVKLAFEAFSHQKNVGLITEDFNRPGAEAQLRALTQLMTLPLSMVSSPPHLAEEIRNLQSMDLIIVDTAGRSIRDHAGLEALRDNLLAAAPHETHLVLPATLSDSSAMEISKAYRVCNYNRVLVSKLDEAMTFGLLLNLARKISEPFTYLALGQSFRNGFVKAEPEEMAKLVMGDDHLFNKA